MQLVPLQRGHRSEPLSCDSVHAVPHSGHECSVVFIGIVRLVFGFLGRSHRWLGKRKSLTSSEAVGRCREVSGCESKEVVSRTKIALL